MNAALPNSAVTPTTARSRGPDSARPRRRRRRRLPRWSDSVGPKPRRRPRATPRRRPSAAPRRRLKLRAAPRKRLRPRNATKNAFARQSKTARTANSENWNERPRTARSASKKPRNPLHPGTSPRAGEQLPGILRLQLATTETVKAALGVEPDLPRHQMEKEAVGDPAAAGDPSPTWTPATRRRHHPAWEVGVRTRTERMTALMEVEAGAVVRLASRTHLHPAVNASLAPVSVVVALTRAGGADEAVGWVGEHTPACMSHPRISWPC
mmetsp:Transcript_11921/g.34421  ORF Transcript_11921/g.34421 Transcript_11921/m.34421 type:complete len:267 (+) Transcript_11921:2347-3147(+)